MQFFKSRLNAKAKTKPKPNPWVASFLELLFFLEVFSISEAKKQVVP